MKITINWNDVKAYLRTAGALLLGNSAVVPVLTNFQNQYWWFLAILGIMLFVLTSFNLQKKVSQS